MYVCVYLWNILCPVPSIPLLFHLILTLIQNKELIFFFKIHSRMYCKLDLIWNMHNVCHHITWQLCFFLSLSLSHNDILFLICHAERMFDWSKWMMKIKLRYFMQFEYTIWSANKKPSIHHHYYTVINDSYLETHTHIGIYIKCCCCCCYCKEDQIFLILFKLSLYVKGIYVHLYLAYICMCTR